MFPPSESGARIPFRFWAGHTSPSPGEGGGLQLIRAGELLGCIVNRSYGSPDKRYLTSKRPGSGNNKPLGPALGLLKKPDHQLLQYGVIGAKIAHHLTVGALNG